MKQHSILRPALAAVLAIAAATGVCASASARPEPAPAVGSPYVPTKEINNPIERVGSQLVRGDLLTGAGVEAPLWMPEV